MSQSHVRCSRDQRKRHRCRSTRNLVMQQAIEERGHGGRVAEQLAPIVDRPV
jgi:hypothetical protein